MPDTTLALEGPVRAGVFLGLFAAMALWEAWTPRRRDTLRRGRWPHNIALIVVDSVALRLVLPLLAVEAALRAEAHGWGLLNLLDVPLWLALPVSVLALDLAIYAQHVAFHHVPVLWRLHRVHHTDTAVDVTTALRFHPVEIVLSMAIKMAVVIALGAPAVAVLVFEVLLNGAALFNHGNVALPARLDRSLRRVVVTPDMHRVHHSVHPHETNSNYGFALSWWDRMFGTYTAQPADGHTAMTLGLAVFRAPGDGRLDRLLIQPLHTEAPEQTPPPDSA
ncbi:sterol desaturase family protein [Roseospira marina]|uniref:Sterol desaturase family protein n=1 Tax=Roseospira marina TaxID=140057 RepID=A0A5M6I8I7_9PROT|nr:sterol desaturase family protein [Roseospira marina]KAA5604556.1 sterol desaturase family protein [Roseospira marina]MBB4315303.1 sterol desaturase/sphingolipid hydroxylase (fatty acid hydroxylase superfamily) [Roseospira marina]MBB5088302.1 sterol desaturase/sphingolipid hydroxylase (fatty acid hydroxylase superfamily) [Roseospira marina]